MALKDAPLWSIFVSRSAPRQLISGWGWLKLSYDDPPRLLSTLNYSFFLACSHEPPPAVLIPVGDLICLGVSKAHRGFSILACNHLCDSEGRCVAHSERNVKLKTFVFGQIHLWGQKINGLSKYQEMPTWIISLWVTDPIRLFPLLSQLHFDWTYHHFSTVMRVWHDWEQTERLFPSQRLMQQQSDTPPARTNVEFSVLPNDTSTHEQASRNQTCNPTSAPQPLCVESALLSRKSQRVSVNDPDWEFRSGQTRNQNEPFRFTLSPNTAPIIKTLRLWEAKPAFGWRGTKRYVCKESVHESNSLHGKKRLLML